jgi:VIT1/CCC1 family predicted Fe2+/Mn2+ transporter
MSPAYQYHGEEWHTPRGRFVREVVFGMNDGLITNVGFVAGVTGAVMESQIVFLTGIAAIVAGGIAMFIGAYLSTKAQQEFYRSEIARERREIEETPEREVQEIREIYTNLGFKPDEVEMIVKRVTSDKELWVRFMLREELGILEDNFDDPLKVGGVMGLSFAVGAIPPILPYAFLDDVFTALYVSIAISLLALFTVGVGKVKVTKGNWMKSGMEMMILGSAAALSGYLIGKLVGMIF